MISTYHHRYLVCAILVASLPVGFFEGAVANTFFSCSYALYNPTSQLRICKSAHHVIGGFSQIPIWGIFYCFPLSSDISFAKLFYFEQASSRCYVFGKHPINNSQFEHDEGVVDDIDNDIDSDINIIDNDINDTEIVKSIKDVVTEVMFWSLAEAETELPPAVMSGDKPAEQMTTQYPRLAKGQEMRVQIACATFGENRPARAHWSTVKATCKYSNPVKEKKPPTLEPYFPDKAGSLNIMGPTVF